MSTLSFSFSPSSRLSDIRAFLDSYAVELSIKKVLNIRMPVQYCMSGLGVSGCIKGMSWVGDTVAELPWAYPETKEERCGFSSDDLALALTRYIPPEIGNVSPQAHHHTWPFTVTHPLEIIFTFGEYWWIFKFGPGEQYGERAL